MRRSALLFLFVCLAGCLWRSYGTIMDVHLDVLTQTADKLQSVVASGRGPTAEGMAEYVYPAQRAREFMRQFSSYSSHRSYQQFGALVARYEALVHEVDAARSQGRLGPEEAARVKSESEALRTLAAETRVPLQGGE
jgi:hypothetical protein